VKVQVSEKDPTSAGVNSIDDARRGRLEALSRDHRAYLGDLARRLCRSHFDPDDLVQDVMETAIKEIDRLPEDANLRAWLTRVMKNRFIDRTRRRKTAPQTTSIDDVMVAASAPAAADWWETLDAEDIRKRLDALPDELRVTFELFAFERASYEAISAQLGVPKGTIGTRILRARRRLKQLFTGAADQDEAPGRVP
jgi:RNA polymerase sigma-70 factor, ECF subfamily